MSINLSVSLVVCNSSLFELVATISTLRESLSVLPTVDAEIIIVDNMPNSDEMKTWAAKNGVVSIILIAGQGNIGYGSAHNLVLDRIDSNYHLILNPDVELAPNALVNALSFLDEHSECGLLAPASTDAGGQRQYLCKRSPSLFDLFLRGFAPSFVKRLFSKRLDSYEMKDVIEELVYWDPPIVSGCFMLFRTSVLKQLGGFDPRFFLYFEDFDLSLRASGITRIAYVPSVKIVHHGGNTARKGIKHIFFFLESAVKFFNKHGWKLY